MAETVSIRHSKSSEETPAAPDSTTSMFAEGEDVLVDRHQTGRFFMGTIVRIDQATERCLLRFLDNQECWAQLNELQHMKDDPAERLCVVCKKTGKNVLPCPKCGRGYHKACQQPNLVEGLLGSKRVCRRCGDTSKKRNRQINELSSSEQVLGAERSQLSTSSSASSQTSSHTHSNVRHTVLSSSSPCTSGSLHQLQKSVPIHQQLPMKKQKLPYDLSSLSWDEHKLFNEEQCYCYCAQSGTWFLQMLQCIQCQQWFHQDCLTCLNYPLYCGDRFYVFLCSICNGGQEYVRRLEMKWVDIVHLSIFNLMLFSGKKYFDLDKEILPFVVKNWFFMQLPTRMFECRETDLREIIFRTLRGNSLRFKCGREIKVRTTIWGLQTRMPPAQPDICLPGKRPITDTILWKANPLLSCIPPLSSIYLMKGKAVLHPDGKMYAFNYQLMLGGTRCVQSSYSLRQAARGLHLLDATARSTDSQPGVPVNGGKVCVKSVGNCGGYAKKSSAYRAPNRLTLQESLLRHKRSKRLQPKELQGQRKSTRKVSSSREGSDSQDSQTSDLSHDEVSNDDPSEYEQSVDETSQDGVTSQDGQTTYSSSEEGDSSVNSERSASDGSVSSEESENEDEDWRAKPRALDWTSSPQINPRILRQRTCSGRQLQQEGEDLEDSDEDEPLERRRLRQLETDVEQECIKTSNVSKQGKDVPKQKHKQVSEVQREFQHQIEIVPVESLQRDLSVHECDAELERQKPSEHEQRMDALPNEGQDHKTVEGLEQRQDDECLKSVGGFEQVQGDWGRRCVEGLKQELSDENTCDLDRELSLELEHVNKRVREQELESELLNDLGPEQMPKVESFHLYEEESERLHLVLTPPPSGTPNTPQPTGSPKSGLTNSGMNQTTPADTEAEDEVPIPCEPHVTTFRNISELLGGPIVMQPKAVSQLIPSLPPLTPVIFEPPKARTIKRKLSEKDIKIVNGVVKRRRSRRSQHSHIVSTVRLDSGEKIEKRIVGGKLLRSPHKPNVPEPASCAVEEVQPCSENPSTTTTSQQLEISFSDIKKSVGTYFSAGNRIAAGEKFRIIGKRTTALGTEYLIEWDYPPF